MRGTCLYWQFPVLHSNFPQFFKIVCLWIWECEYKCQCRSKLGTEYSGTELISSWEHQNWMLETKLSHQQEHYVLFIVLSSLFSMARAFSMCCSKGKIRKIYKHAIVASLISYKKAWNEVLRKRLYLQKLIEQNCNDAWEVGMLKVQILYKLCWVILSPTSICCLTLYVICCEH